MIRLSTICRAQVLLLLSSVFVCSSPVLALASPAYVYPLMGPRVSSDYGWRSHPIYHVVKHHEGVDLAAPDGAPIRAIQSGIVVFADPYGGYGNFIVVQHPNGLTSHYGHCATFRVRPGQKVHAGEILGTVGSTGNVTGPHLHFEIRRGGHAENPEDYLPGLAMAAEG